MGFAGREAATLMEETAANGRKVLFIVENLPSPFDRRVWQEATTLTQAVICFGLCSFCITAWSGNEFALLQRQLPAALTAQCSGFYNGMTAMIGGGLGPFVTSAVMSSEQSLWPLYLLCVGASLLLFFLSRLLRY